MPKIVDHEARRAEISAALWRIVEREGISSASIRSVAKEAGYPKATAMHYFKNEAELLTCAMDQFIARSQSKISTLLEGTLTTDKFIQAIIHAIPTTESKRRLASIWLEIVNKSTTDEYLRDYLVGANRQLDSDLESLLIRMQDQDLVAQKHDPALHARKLHALIDGLTLHAMTSNRTTSVGMIKKIVSAQVQELAH